MIKNKEDYDLEGIVYELMAALLDYDIYIEEDDPFFDVLVSMIYYPTRSIGLFAMKLILDQDENWFEKRPEILQSLSEDRQKIYTSMLSRMALEKERQKMYKEQAIDKQIFKGSEHPDIDYKLFCLANKMYENPDKIDDEWIEHVIKEELDLKHGSVFKKYMVPHMGAAKSSENIIGFFVDHLQILLNNGGVSESVKRVQSAFKIANEYNKETK